MICGGVDGRKAVSTSGQTTGHFRAEHAANGSIVQALEEGERRWVCRRRRRDAINGLDDDMRVALNVALRVHLLRSSEIVLLGVDEEACVKIIDCHRDGKVSVRLHCSEIRRERELGRGHVRCGCDDTHGGGVARTGLDLLTIRNRQVGNGGTEVDEVIRRREGRNLACFGSNGDCMRENREVI